MKKSKKLVAFAMALVCVFSLLSVFTPKSQVMAATTESISAVADVVFYDAEGNIVYVETTSKFLNAKEIDTSTVYIAKSLEYDHYKILVRGYSEKYIR